MPPALRQSARIARAREEEAAEVASRPAKQAKVQVKPAVRPPKPAVKEEVEVVKTEESDGSGSEGTDEEEQEEEDEEEEEEEEEASEEEASPEPDSDEYDEDGRWVGKPVELTPDVQVGPVRFFPSPSLRFPPCRPLTCLAFFTEASSRRSLHLPPPSHIQLSQDHPAPTPRLGRRLQPRHGRLHHRPTLPHGSQGAGLLRRGEDGHGGLPELLWRMWR